MARTVLVEDKDGKRYGSRNLSDEVADRMIREATAAIKNKSTNVRINFETLDGLETYMFLREPVGYSEE